MTEPTHVTPNSYIYFVSPVKVESCNTVPPLSNGDHSGLCICMASKTIKNKHPITRTVWIYSLADFDKAMELIDAIEILSSNPD